MRRMRVKKGRKVAVECAGAVPREGGGGPMDTNAVQHHSVGLVDGRRLEL